MKLQDKTIIAKLILILIVIVLVAAAGYFLLVSRKWQRQSPPSLLHNFPIQENKSSVLIGLNNANLFRMYAGLGPVFSKNPRLARQLAIKSLDDAQKYGFTYMRINGGGFYGSEFTQWKSNPNAWWQAFDQMVNDASSRNIKLIPSIAWCIYAFPNEAGEPVTRFFQDSSRSNRDLKEYTRELVTRYKDNPDILFWELGNEYNLKSDHVSSGDTACQAGSGNGSYSSSDLATFVTDYAYYIKSLDPNHLISSGYSRPRPYAYHLWQSYLSNKKPDYHRDSQSELKQYLRAVYPISVDLMSVHMYPEKQGKVPDWTISDLVSAARQINKQVFVGEFGDLGDNGQWKANSPFVDNILQVIQYSHIPYSAAWTWETYKNVSPVEYKEYSLVSGRQPDQIWINKFINLR